jgi:tRNA pseudouridine55 synthase
MEPIGTEPECNSTMPKATNPTLPLHGLFGLIKPSGPTSMSLLDALKPLFFESSLFVTDDAERRAFIGARKKRGKAKSGTRAWSSKKLKGVKIGQGGTLDPLADGVLGEHTNTE